jgi:undecaprenyl-diphosphatase
MTVTQALILAVVEGLTEFLPVSSTGHMIIVSSLMGISSDEFTKIFTVNIQFGTILSVVVLYYKRFFQSIQFYMLLLAAFIPAAILGFLLGDFIDSLLENVVVVACMLIIGGVFFLFLDKLFPTKDTTPIASTKNTLDNKAKNQTPELDPISSLSYLKAFLIGCFQCLALVPGVSRAAATIVGGLSQGLNRKNAAEFSFFLAVPTMFAASAYKLLKDHSFINQDNMSLLLLGNVVGFIVALLAIKGFISFVTQRGFALFGYYRIILGLLVLALYYFGIKLQVS